MNNERLTIKEKKYDTPVIIIAAGRGKRFGTYPKILSNLNGKPVIYYVLNNAIKSRAGNVFLILGYKCKFIYSLLKSNPLTRKFVDKITVLYNKNWKKGKSSSIRVAINNIPENSQGILVLLGDMPYITLNMIKKAKEEFIKNRCNKIIYFGDKNNLGHPVIFPEKYFNELLKLKKEEGGKELIKKHTENAISIGPFCQAVQKDIDSSSSANFLDSF